MRPLGSLEAPIRNGWTVFGLQLTILIAAIALGVDGFVNTDGNQVLLVSIILAAVSATFIVTRSARMLVRRKSERRTDRSSIDLATIWPSLAQEHKTIELRAVRRTALAPGRRRKTGNDQ
jgi:hypothetical protein